MLSQGRKRIYRLDNLPSKVYSLPDVHGIIHNWFAPKLVALVFGEAVLDRARNTVPGRNAKNSIRPDAMAHHHTLQSAGHCKLKATISGR
jgi:hypothetical protein